MAREQLQTLSEPMYYTLLALTEECCGIDIMEKVKTLSHGRVLIGPGTLYAMLAKFEEKGIIKLTASDGRKNPISLQESESMRCKKNLNGCRPWFRTVSFTFYKADLTHKIYNAITKRPSAFGLDADG